jgi:hypothetical protein
MAPALAMVDNASSNPIVFRMVDSYTERLTFGT